jgi:hypothetical protein
MAPIYGADGLFNANVRAVQSTSAARAGGAQDEARAVSARRAEAMRGFFPKLFSWFADQFDMARMREVESYLAQATDLCDLENRIRRLERNMPGSFRPD